MALKASNAQSVKEDFQQYVLQASRLINSPQTRAQVLGMLKGQDPVNKIAATTVMVMQRLDESLRKMGVEMQDAIKAIGAYAIVDQLTKLGEAAGLFKLDDDFQTLALSIATQNYINAEVKAGHINRQQLSVTIQADMRQMPQKMRDTVSKTMTRLPMIAKRYQKEVRDGRL